MHSEGQKIKRSKQISQNYLDFLDKHIDDVIQHHTLEFLGINTIASELAVSHKHLTDVVQKEMGNHPCYFYDLKIIEKIKEMLLTTEMSVAKIAEIFTYDPSNFSKFFKKWTGMTPKAFRENTKEIRNISQLPKSSP